MNLEEIQNIAVETYLNNINYLEKTNPVLHRKLLVLDEGINSELIIEKEQLELKDNEYFDIYNVENDSWFYGTNSSKYSEEITKKIDLDLTVNSFKTFYEFHYEDGVLEQVKKASITSSTVFGNAPVVDYINRNSPEKRVSKQMFCYMIFGVGLGFHIPLIQKSVNAKLYCIVEPNLEIFRLSLFTVSYEDLAKKGQLIFFVANDKETFTTRFREFHEKAYMYNQYIKFFLFSKNCEIYFEGIQSMLSSQSHNMFAYDRELMSLMRTSDYTHDNFNFFKVNERAELKQLNNLPLLVLAGGPSLKKNMEFIKENQDKFLIMSILSISPFLQEHGIEPDFITNYDESEVFVDIYNKVADKTFFENKTFLFSSHIHPSLVSLIPKENIYFFNALFSMKKNYGMLTGPSIGEMTYGLGMILGFENIYILGLDLALDSKTGESHFEGYQGSQFTVDRDASIEKFSFRKNVINTKGNLKDIVETTAVFSISIRQLDIFTKLYNPDKKLKAFNFSDGAYFEGVEPLRIEEFDFSKLERLDKKILSKDIKDSLNLISSNDFTQIDIEEIEISLLDAKLLKENIERILTGQKHSSIDNYLISLESLDDEIINHAKYKCHDVMKIMSNYFKHNLPYIFFFFSLKDLSNPKNHIKKVNKELLNQIIKIMDLYISLLELNIEGKSSN